MDSRINERLNQIPEKMLSPEFLSGQGLGNEIGFWIFDYLPEHELEVRRYVDFLLGVFEKKHDHLNIINVNLLTSLIDYLKERNFLDKAIQLQKQKGNDSLLKALKGPLHMDKFVPYITEKYSTTEQDIVWSLLRAHNLLNSLHSILGHKPVILFYPGKYDGQVMSLFGKIPSDNYYRAFRLVS